MKIALTRAAFIAAASVVQAKNDVRYYLNGILIEKAPDKGLLIVATDGHRLVAALDEDAEFSDDMPEQVIIQFGPESLRVAKLAKNLDERVDLEIADTDVFVSIGTGCFQDSKTIDGTYPDWRRIVVEQDGQSTGWFNASYVADFERVARFFTARTRTNINGITLRSSDAKSAALVYFDGAPYAFGLVMPYQCDRENPQLPAWTAQPVKAAKPVKDAIAA